MRERAMTHTNLLVLHLANTHRPGREKGSTILHVHPKTVEKPTRGTRRRATLHVCAIKKDVFRSWRLLLLITRPTITILMMQVSKITIPTRRQRSGNRKTRKEE